MRKKILQIIGALCSVVGVLFTTAYSTMASDVFNNITGTPESNDIFSGVTKVAEGVGNSAINLFTVGGAILVVIGIMLCGMSLILFKGDSEVTKNKKHILVIVGASILIFGSIGIGKGFADIGSSVGASFEEADTTTPANQGQQGQ